jgi:hypothetical protein
MRAPITEAHRNYSPESLAVSPCGVDAMIAEVVCPTCGGEHNPPVRLIVETSRRAAKRPASSELVHVCPACGAMLILSIGPAPQMGVAP